MPERTTARDRLERVLYVLPAAAREGGVTLDELESALDVPRETIVDDVREVLAREFYHPAGGADTLRVTIEPDRIVVWSGGEFRRPVRLSPREALALGLALRARATGAQHPRRLRLLELARRIERELATTSPDELLPRVALGPGVGAGDGLRAFFRTAVEERRRSRICYLKPGDDSPTDRVIRPYALVFAEGAWYTIGYCQLAEGVRVFRLDRVLEAEPASAGDGEGDGEGGSGAGAESRVGADGGAGFEVPEDFDPEAYVSGGRKLYYAEDDVEVAVRYSPRIARWLAEREDVEREPDGAVVVRHQVADPEWLVRHVLRYGPDAEVLRPEAMRDVVADAVRGPA